MDDKPVLTIDGTTRITLAQRSYAPVDLVPGKHHVKIESDPQDSSAWNVEGDLEIRTVERYYLAVWNSEFNKSFDAGARVCSRRRRTCSCAGQL